MGIPKNGVKLSTIRDVNSKADACSSSSSAKLCSDNGVQKKIALVNGKEVLGFYKKLDPALAKQSVLASVFLRLSLGDKAAEELLVFDVDEKDEKEEKAEIVGVFSTMIPNLTTLPFRQDEVSDKDKKLALPSTETILQKNTFFLLFFHYLFDNDDIHPHNLSLGAMFDMDNMLWVINQHIKERKPGEVKGFMGYNIFFHLLDWIHLLQPDKNFIQDKNNPKVKIPTHSPFYGKPVNFNLLKRYKKETVHAFREIVKEPNKAKRATLQIYKAALQFLLTYQPEVLKERLIETFGEIKSHQQDPSFPQHKKVKLKEHLPDLFNRNIELFVDYGLKLYQKYYDTLFIALVYFDNTQNSELPLNQELREQFKSFHHFLSSPEGQKAVGEVKEWINNQNQSSDAASSSSSQGKSSTSLSIEAFKKRYLKIKRESLFPIVKAICYSAREIATDLTSELCKNGTSSLRTPSEFKFDHFADTQDVAKKFNDKLKLIKNSVTTHCERDNGYNICLNELIELNNQLLQCWTEFQSLPMEALNDAIFDDFLEKIKGLSIQYKTLKETKAPTFEPLNKLINIHLDLLKLSKYGKPGNQNSLEKWECGISVDRSLYDHPDIVNKTIVALFNWIDTLKPHVFQQEIRNILNNDYKPNNYVSQWLYNRYRGPEVEQLLRTSTRKNSVILAEILSVGTPEEPGALNPLLVQHFLSNLLRSQFIDLNLELEPVKKAFEDSSNANESFNFDYRPFIKQSNLYSKDSTYFRHKNVDKINDIMLEEILDFADIMGQGRFKQTVDNCLNKYGTQGGLTSKSYRFFRRNDKAEDINKKLENLANNSCATILAEIFSEGNFSNDNSFNVILFNTLLECMEQHTIDSKNKRISEYNHFMDLLKDKSKRDNFILKLNETSKSYLDKAANTSENKAANTPENKASDSHEISMASNVKLHEPDLLQESLRAAASSSM